MSQLVASHVRVNGLFLCEAHFFLMAQEMGYKLRGERISREPQEQLHCGSVFRPAKGKVPTSKRVEKVGKRGRSQNFNAGQEFVR